MFFLPTRARPHEARDLIAAMRAVDDVPEMAVRIDGPPFDGYRELDWPDNWHVVYGERRLEMTVGLNDLQARFPFRDFYGHMSDHFRPTTKWSRPLIDAAGDWFIAWPSDGNESCDRDVVGAPCYGAKLIHKLGFFMLTGTVHLCTTRPFWLLWKDLGIGRCVEGVRFDRTWPVGRGMVPREFNGLDFNRHDYNTWANWREEEAPTRIREIREAMEADGYRFGPDGKIAAEYGCTPFKPGL